ncbi:hypothetical protein Y1Q_0002032 [Alligator mississippiensis]|uniref:Uncharacterized protein n=1 Tax=Alligator mississippiensis TaxID=8496 RepID=A0A151MIN4_ALLMI|nr:hypothetical protein Y1Q_0002032 [Alligator mississippiensis]
MWNKWDHHTVRIKSFWLKLLQSFSRTSFRKVLKPVLNLLKVFQPKVDLPAQLAVCHAENEEEEEMVEENPEAKQQQEGKEEIESSEETVQTESSLYVGSSLALSTDNEQLSENAGERSSVLEAQRSGFYDDVRHAWAIEDSFYMCELETLAEGSSQNEEISPISGEMDVDTAAPKKQSSFFMKIPNALSRVHSFLSSCLPHRKNLQKVSPEITPTH